MLHELLAISLDGAVYMNSSHDTEYNNSTVTASFAKIFKVNKTVCTHFCIFLPFVCILTGSSLAQWEAAGFIKAIITQALLSILSK